MDTAHEIASEVAMRGHRAGRQRTGGGLRACAGTFVPGAGTHRTWPAGARPPSTRQRRRRRRRRTPLQAEHTMPRTFVECGTMTSPHEDDDGSPSIDEDIWYIWYGTSATIVLCVRTAMAIVDLVSWLCSENRFIIMMFQTTHYMYSSIKSTTTRTLHIVTLGHLMYSSIKSTTTRTLRIATHACISRGLATSFLAAQITNVYVEAWDGTLRVPWSTSLRYITTDASLAGTPRWRHAIEKIATICTAGQRRRRKARNGTTYGMSKVLKGVVLSTAAITLMVVSIPTALFWCFIVDTWDIVRYGDLGMTMTREYPSAIKDMLETAMGTGADQPDDGARSTPQADGRCHDGRNSVSRQQQRRCCLSIDAQESLK